MPVANAGCCRVFGLACMIGYLPECQGRVVRSDPAREACDMPAGELAAPCDDRDQPGENARTDHDRAWLPGGGLKPV